MKINRQRGFSLIELLIVVGIILVIAAIAIPNLLRSRIAANEASATASLRMLNNAEVIFSATYSSGYTEGLNRLGSPSSGQPDFNNADLVDPVLAGRLAPYGTNTSFVKSGYTFVYTPVGSSTVFGSIPGYEISADPLNRGSSGQRSFFTNEPLVIRSNATNSAGPTDPPI